MVRPLATVSCAQARAAALLASSPRCVRIFSKTDVRRIEAILSTLREAAGRDRLLMAVQRLTRLAIDRSLRSHRDRSAL
jgi:hypothetical protein